MTATEIADLIHNQPQTEDVYLFIGGHAGKVDYAFRLQKNSAYNLIFSFLEKYPEYLSEVADAVKDVSDTTKTPSSRPE